MVTRHTRHWKLDPLMGPREIDTLCSFPEIGLLSARNVENWLSCIVPYKETPPPPGWKDSARPTTTKLIADARDVKYVIPWREPVAPPFDRPISKLTVLRGEISFQTKGQCPVSVAQTVSMPLVWRKHFTIHCHFSFLLLPSPYSRSTRPCCTRR